MNRKGTVQTGSSIPETSAASPVNSEHQPPSPDGATTTTRTVRREGKTKPTFIISVHTKKFLKASISSSRMAQKIKSVRPVPACRCTAELLYWNDLYTPTVPVQENCEVTSLVMKYGCDPAEIGYAFIGHCPEHVIVRKAINKGKDDICATDLPPDEQLRVK
ncbi:hypothetical protein CBL_09619 [Carabus blaptoides fortunei]